MDYHGRRVTVMGLGHFGGGVAAARWLAGQEAVVTVTEAADRDALADVLPFLDDLPLAAIRLGGHRELDFHGADLVVVNPAVRPNNPWLAVARQSGARLRTELELFMENCPARIVGVTGSNGKSTTAAMLASILRAAGRRTFLGGNIGGSLLERLSEIGRDDWVVLEISSFQLWHFSPAARMPQVAVVTGCTPNHLDWHATLADYIAAKQRILTGQMSDDVAVLNAADAEVASWSGLVRGRRIAVSSRHAPRAVADAEGRATRKSSTEIGMASAAGGGTRSVPTTCGEHDRINAACAAAAAATCGCGEDAIRESLQRFRGLPQRLQWIAVVDGRRVYNDSAATTSESTIAALRSLDVPAWLLAGGKSKGVDVGPLVAEIVDRARGAAFFGASGTVLRQRTLARQPQFCCAAVETMDDALRWCWARSRPGEVILLSPACASTDQFLNFQQRGDRFVELIRHIAGTLRVP